VLEKIIFQDNPVSLDGFRDAMGYTPAKITGGQTAMRKAVCGNIE